MDLWCKNQHRTLLSLHYDAWCVVFEWGAPPLFRPTRCLAYNTQPNIISQSRGSIYIYICKPARKFRGRNFRLCILKQGLILVSYTVYRREKIIRTWKANLFHSITAAQSIVTCDQSKSTYKRSEFHIDNSPGIYKFFHIYHIAIGLHSHTIYINTH